MSTEDLLNSPDIFRILIERSVDAIGFADLEGKILFANQALKDLSGYGEATVGLPIFAMFEAATLAIVNNEVLPALGRVGRWQGDLWLKRPDGTRWLGQLHAAMLYDAAGQPIATSASYRDVTAERTRERQLANVNERSEQLLRTSPLATIECNLRGELVRWNPAAERIFGWSAAEALGQNVLNLLVPDLAQEHVDAVIKALLSGESADSRNENVTKDGRRIICQWYNASLRDRDGQVIGWVSQTADITEQVQAMDALAENQRMLDNMMGNLAGMVYRCRNDRDWTMTFVSQGALPVTGYPPEAFLPDANGETKVHFGDLIVAEDQAMVWEQTQAAVNQGQRFQLNYRLRAADGTLRYAWEQGNPVYDREGQVIAIEGYIVDVTAQRSAELEQDRLQDEIIAAQEAALRELSTPIIPITDGVIAMPLIGAIDSRRAQQVIETLLEGVAEHQARVAILDITGVPVVDTQVADALLRSAQAVKLVGANVVLTGIRPEVAQTLVGLGLNLSGITTLASLQAGIAYALRRNR